MRILYTLNSADPGGMEEHVLGLVGGMVGLGHEVFVWCPWGPKSNEYKQAGAKVTNTKIVLDIDPVYIFALAKFLKKEKIQVLHAHELKAVANSLIAGFIAGVNVRISHTHTPISEWKIQNFKKVVNLIFYKISVNLLATKEIALTESRKRVKMKEGIREGKLEVLPNGIDWNRFTITGNAKSQYREEIFDEYKIEKDSFIFGNLGRISEEKGIFILIEAFLKFLQFSGVAKNRTHLLIAGGGPLEKGVLEKIADLGLEKKVSVTGRFSDEDKIKFLSSFDCFIFPSLAEGFGIVLLEAMAFSLPVICSDLEVLQEIGGSTVMFFETGNPHDLAEKMYGIYSRRDNLENLEVAARKRVEELYSIERFIRAYEDLYTSLLEKS